MFVAPPLGGWGVRRLDGLCRFCRLISDYLYHRDTESIEKHREKHTVKHCENIVKHCVNKKKIEKIVWILQIVLAKTQRISKNDLGVFGVLIFCGLCVELFIFII
jgi:hypothetical protein